MKLCTAAQMRELDAFAIDTLGIPGASLMRNAARQVFDATREGLDCSAGVAVFCGTGNNGGDGIGAAAYLVRAGISTRVFLIGEREKMSADSREMLRLLEEYGGEIEGYDATAAAEYVVGCGVIIDAIFGTGLGRIVLGDALSAIDIINSSAARVVSADIPSGVSADTGEILGASVCADVTVTFSCMKPGLVLTPGCISAGQVRVCDIGIPQELLRGVRSEAFAVTAEDITLPERSRDSHKYHYGRALIVAGSLGYTGAPIMAAKACSRAGAGLVQLGVPESIYQIAAVSCLGEMPFPLSGGDTVSAGAWGQLRERKADAILIGPGLQNTDGTRTIVENALTEGETPVILDADGINALARNIDVLDKALPPVILTPHDGEFRRLAGDHSDRLGAARSFAKKHGCVVILKGYRTITALPDGTAYINTTGNPGMAKGGSGDVLAGMLTALIAQGFAIKDACIAAVFLHGRAGDIAAGRLGEYSVTPEDILDGIPEAFLSVKSI